MQQKIYKITLPRRKKQKFTLPLFLLQIRDHPVRGAHLHIPFTPSSVVAVHVTALCQEQEEIQISEEIEKYLFIFQLVFSHKIHSKQDFLMKHIMCMCGWALQGSMLCAQVLIQTWYWLIDISYYISLLEIAQIANSRDFCVQ